MSSLRRILASRANGARSQGPVTGEGKQRSSRNALRHGMLAAIVVMEDESAETFEDLLARHVERLQPADDVELGLVEEMVTAQWRMRRGWAIETRMFDNAALPANSANPGDPVDRMANAFASLAATP